jgi:hypothetical protein
MKTQDLSNIMNAAWRFFRITGQPFASCLKKAWANFKLLKALHKGIVKFYFQKVDGTIREAWGTLKNDLIPQVQGTDDRKRNDTVYLISLRPSSSVVLFTSKENAFCG